MAWGTSINFTAFLQDIQTEGSITYLITVETTNCETETATLTIIVAADAIRIPEVITPNGDDKNDELMISLPGGEIEADYQLTIFSRSGVVVHQQTLAEPNWTGAGLS